MNENKLIPKIDSIIPIEDDKINDINGIEDINISADIAVFQKLSCFLFGTEGSVQKRIFSFGKLCHGLLECFSVIIIGKDNRYRNCAHGFRCTEVGKSNIKEGAQNDREN